MATVPGTVLAGPGPVTVTVTVNGIVSNASVTFTALNPVITSVTPATAAASGRITITGTGFGTYGGQVNFNNVAGSTYSWSDTSISAEVPQNATSGQLTVLAQGFASAGVPFTVEGQPNVSALSPAVGPIGGTVTVSGSGFGATQSNSVLQFNGVTATASSWSDGEIVVTVPAGATTGPVTVTVANLTGQSAPFTVSSTVQVTDSAGNVSNYTSDMVGGAWYVSDSQGSGCSSCTMRGTNHNDYDSAGNVLDSIDELSHETTYSYDANGNQISQTQTLDSTTNVAWNYTYNSFGEALTATDPLGNVTTNAYDSHGNLLSITTPAPDANTAASVTQFGYDTKGELTSITDPAGWPPFLSRV